MNYWLKRQFNREFDEIFESILINFKSVTKRRIGSNPLGRWQEFQIGSFQFTLQKEGNKPKKNWSLHRFSHFSLDWEHVVTFENYDDAAHLLLFVNLNKFTGKV